MKLTPLADRVVVRRVESEAVTASGLVIPDVAKEKPAKGIVEALGYLLPQRADPEYNGALDIGDTVLFSKYAGYEVKLGDRDCVVLRYEEILGILTDE